MTVSASLAGSKGCVNYAVKDLGSSFSFRLKVFVIRVLYLAACFILRVAKNRMHNSGPDCPLLRVCGEEQQGTGHDLRSAPRKGHHSFDPATEHQARLTPEWPMGLKASVLGVWASGFCTDPSDDTQPEEAVNTQGTLETHPWFASSSSTLPGRSTTAMALESPGLEWFGGLGVLTCLGFGDVWGVLEPEALGLDVES